MSDEKGQEPNIVFLPDAVGEQKKFPALRVVESYWRELRGDRTVPQRSEIDPRRIEKALECAFILERLAPGVARFRLAGMHLNELMGMEVRGMPLTSCFLPDARRQVGTVLEQVFEQPATASLSLAGDRGIGKPPLDARMILLPLASDLGETSRILGCLASLGPVGRTPRRFALRDLRVQSLVDDIGGDDRAPEWEMTPAASAAFAEAQAPFMPPRPPRAPDGKPRLYLVKNDEEE